MEMSANRREPKSRNALPARQTSTVAPAVRELNERQGWAGAMSTSTTQLLQIMDLLNHKTQVVAARDSHLSHIMIRSLMQKGVERFFKSGSRAGIQAAHAPRLDRQLVALDAAKRPKDMNGN